MERVRILVTCDKKTNIDLRDLYKKDLVLSIVKDGVLNAYLPIPVKFKDDVLVSVSRNAVAQNTTITHIGLSLRDETLNPATEKPQELGKS